MESRSLKGINFKTNKAGDILVGIHLKTFLDDISQFLNSDGWANFTIYQLKELHTKGYTHRATIKNNGSYKQIRAEPLV